MSSVVLSCLAVAHEMHSRERPVRRQISSAASRAKQTGNNHERRLQKRGEKRDEVFSGRG